MSAAGQLWFNELSHVVQRDIFAADRLIVGLIDTLAEARRNGCKARLRLGSNLFAIELSANYRIANWAATTRDVNRRQLLRTWAANWPFLQSTEAAMQARTLSYDFAVGGRAAVGIGLAWLFEGLAVSFDTEPFFAETVDLSVYRLVDASGKDVTDDSPIIETEERVPHISAPRHVSVAMALLKQNRMAAVNDGKILWEDRALLLNNLDFCDGVEEVIAGLGANDPHFVAVRRMLRDLNSVAETWLDGDFPRDRFPGKITPESDSTLSRYGTQRDFKDSQSVSRRFSLHGRLTPGAWRYYIYSEKVDGRLLIGYIGPKLSTVTDPT